MRGAGAFVALFISRDWPFFFFFKNPAPTEIYPLSLPDALPISPPLQGYPGSTCRRALCKGTARRETARSEEHTSELQSRQYLVCRLLLEKKKIDQENYRALGNHYDELDDHHEFLSLPIRRPLPP